MGINTNIHDMDENPLIQIIFNIHVQNRANRTWMNAKVIVSVEIATDNKMDRRDNAKYIFEGRQRVERRIVCANLLIK
jgi:hypothetical protein